MLPALKMTERELIALYRQLEKMSVVKVRLINDIMISASDNYELLAWSKNKSNVYRRVYIARGN